MITIKISKYEQKKKQEITQKNRHTGIFSDVSKIALIINMHLQIRNRSGQVNVLRRHIL